MQMITSFPEQEPNLESLVSVTRVPAAWYSLPCDCYDITDTSMFNNVWRVVICSDDDRIVHALHYANFTAALVNFYLY